MSEDLLKEKVLGVLRQGITTVNNTLEDVYKNVESILTPQSLPLKFGRYMFAHDEKPMDEQARWKFQVLQGNFPQDAAELKSRGVEVIRYCHPATYVGSEVDAIGKLDHNLFFLRDINNNLIKSNYPGQDNALFVDVGNVEYQKLSAEFLIRVCHQEGWDGVLIDEVNQQMEWAGYTVRPKSYPTDYSFQTRAWLPYIKYVSAALRNAGLKVYANISFADEFDYWCKNILREVDGTLHEFFIGREPIASTSSIENWGFQIQYNWMKYNEDMGKKSLYQVRTTDPKVVEYALAILLLGVKENTNASFAWAVGEPGYAESHKWNESFSQIPSLGIPGGLSIIDGLYIRHFSHGVVMVNPSEVQKPWGNKVIPPLTGKIIFNV